MNNLRNLRKYDIDDDEIRIISGEAAVKSGGKRKRRTIIVVSIVIVSVIVGVIAGILLDRRDVEAQMEDTIGIIETDFQPPAAAEISAGKQKKASYSILRDTVVDDVPLTIIKPVNATPSLVIGESALNDTTAVLVTQAADIRSDNGEIVGAFVLNGNLISRGKSKAGYCAIINGKITIGVAETTPLLEKATETNGFFFRQYPLVVENQVIENRSKRKSLRKALALLDDDVVVILSHYEMSFHDFSQTLVDLGVTNAIYLIGSTAYGFAKDANGAKIEFGIRRQMPEDTNFNYIVWH